MIEAGPIIDRVARDRGLDVVGITGPSRSKWYVMARREIAVALYMIGCNPMQISRILQKDYSTISFYLGRKQGRRSMSTISCTYRIYPAWFGGEVAAPMKELAYGAAAQMGRRVEGIVKTGAGFDRWGGHFVDFRITYSSTNKLQEAKQ